MIQFVYIYTFLRLSQFFVLVKCVCQCIESRSLVSQILCAVAVVAIFFFLHKDRYGKQWQ